MGNLAALPHKELSENQNLWPSELDVSEYDWRRRISQACNLEFLNDISLHGRAREAEWIDFKSFSGLGAAVFVILGSIRQICALIDKLDAKV